MKKFTFLLCFLLNFTVAINAQFFSDNCSGGTNILPIQDINLCNDSEWVLVFEDNFDGDSLDRGKWKNRQDQQGSLTTDIEQHYSTLENAIVEDGLLKITAKKEHIYALSVAWKDSNEILSDGLPNIRWYDYTTAYIFSVEKFGFGYFEASCKIPSGKGFGSAMWMYTESQGPDNANINEEIDVFEIDDNKPNDFNMNIHYDGYVCQSDYKGPDFSKEFHTYSLIWEPYKLEWYIDGELIRRYPRYTQNGSDVGCLLNAWQPFQEAPFPRHPTDLIFNFTIDNREGKKPDASTVFPSTFEIDWVRYHVREDLIDMEYKSDFFSQVFPNPNQGLLTIEIPDSFSDRVQIKLFSAYSKLILTQNLHDSINHIDLSSLENGIYFLQVENKETFQVNHHKIIISR
ncbi:MAG: family 16 glycosylhydrolase [Bacteroidales bacterium]|nr:family 16 glycosylhydrolase [Bacteroidales bacterium]MCF8455288.1 family 16 glycosylhydrolase [Bacteroidales bacterium]